VTNRLAVLIDVENIHYSTLNSYSETPDWEWIVEACKKKGKIASIQAFGDWIEFSAEVSQMQKNGIQPIFVPLSQNGKSSLDCYLTVSAMKLFFQNDTIDTLILASGDRDYIPLIAELKANGKNVIILAVADTLSSELKGMVDDIIEYAPPTLVDRYESDDNYQTTTNSSQYIEEFIKNTLKELEESSTNDRWINLAAIGLALKGKNSNFSHKDYGYSKLVGMLENIDGIEVKYDNYEKTIALARTTRDKKSKKRYEGYIITLNRDRGYGFIKPIEDGENIFFHSSRLINIPFESLVEGDRVIFDIINTDRGISAENVECVY